jgi:hypothetical protein
MARAAKKVVEPKEAETKEVVVAKETKDLQVQDSSGRALQAGPTVDMSEQGFDVSDIILPRILLMQSQSDLVAEGKAAPGQFVNSLTGEVLGDAKNPLEIIPLHSPPKTWVTSEKGPRDGRPQFKKIQSEAQILAEYGKSNAKDIPWEENLANGVTRYNKRTLNFYVLLKKEVESGEAFPYLVSFQSTAYEQGKKIATHFMRCAMTRSQPYSRTLKLSSLSNKTEKGNYFTPDIMPGHKSSVDELGAAEQWLPVVKSANVRVDSAEKEEAAARTAEAPAPESSDDLPY